MRRNQVLFPIIFLMLSSSILFESCASKKKIPKSKVSFDTIYFGKSGGFANLMEEYALKENGTLYKIREGEEQEINRIKKSQLRKIDKKLNSLNYQTISLEEVGNMTYFIDVKSDDYSNKVTWTNLTDHPDIKELYNALISAFLNP